MAKRFLTPLNLPNLASNPETGTEGDLYFNTVDNVIKIYIDSEWTDLQGGGGSVIGGTNINVDYNEESNTYTVNTNNDLVNIDSISTPDYIQFDTTANVNPVTGLLGWDSVEGTLNLGLSSGKHIHLGEESVFRVRNSTGSTIGKGTALYASGVEPSGRIQVTPYVADGSVREVRFMGLATESISSGVNGFVQHFGYVRDLDTRGTSSTSISVGNETWAAGDLLYVHPTVPGKLTNVKPQHEIVVAIIIIRHQSTGILFVRPTSNGHLEDIHDISLSSLSNEDILIYNSASSIWLNTSSDDLVNSRVENLFIHDNHNNIVSSYDEENNEIILSASVSSGAAIANTDLSQPNANSNTGLLYFNPNDFTFSIAYGGVWLQLANASTQVSGGDSSTTNFEGTFDGGDSSSTYESYLVGGNS
jgi:hypothetical protein